MPRGTPLETDGPIVEVDRVTRRFGAVTAVRDATFAVPRGAVVGVLGPNGAGKTTTIRMITATLPPTSGTVRVNGADTLEQSKRVRRHLGYLPEANPLYPEMTVREYLTFRAGLFGIARRARRGRTESVIERCRVTEMSGRRIGTLSKGYRQRVGLAAALLHDPPVLVLDEPTSGLDPVQIAETRTLIRELAGDRTMLLVSHILPEVEQTCDRLLVFARGEIRADGTPDELLRRHAGANTVDCSVRSGGKTDALSKLAGVTSVERTDADGWADLAITFERDVTDAAARLGAAASDAGLTLRRLERRRPTLESLYTALVTERPSEGAGP